MVSLIKHDSELDAVLRQVSWRLLPLFLAMVVLSYIDRTNLAFAAIQLTHDLKFTPSIFGLGSGIFFLGYATLQIPSNLLLKYTRPNLYLAGIIAAWGISACLFAGMQTAGHFILLRLLLGITEAGAFPGMWYYLSMFYPSDRLTLPYTIVDSGITLSHVIAAPLAASCLSLTGLGGLRGWQWLFILEGIPSVLLAVVFWHLLPSSPEDTRFLDPRQRATLRWHLEAQRSERPSLLSKSSSSGCVGEGSCEDPLLKSPDDNPYDAQSLTHNHSNSGGSGGSRIGAARVAESTPWADVRAGFSNRFAWYLGAVKILHDVASFGIIFWAPTLVDSIINGTALSFGDTGSPTTQLPDVTDPDSTSSPTAADSDEDVGVQAALLTAVPFALAAAFSLVVAHRSQQMNEKIMHIGVPAMVCAALFGLFPWAVAQGPLLGLCCLTFGVIGVYSGSGPTVALLQELCKGPGFVVAAPLFNGIGNIGGFVGPFMVGLLIQRHNSFAIPSLVMAASLFTSGLLVAIMPWMLTLPADIRVGLMRPKAVGDTGPKGWMLAG